MSEVRFPLRGPAYDHCGNRPAGARRDGGAGMSGYEIVAEQLAVHGRQLADLSTRVQGAVDAARTVSMPTDAYGILCQPFRMMLDPVESLGLTALGGAVDALDASGTEIEGAVRQYREMEDGVAQTFRDINGAG
ncbi:hypothetical protein GCM10010428_41950 [Actinosynnema pretiosum subsp. pretiosum]